MDPLPQRVHDDILLLVRLVRVYSSMSPPPPLRRVKEVLREILEEDDPALGVGARAGLAPELPGELTPLDPPAPEDPAPPDRGAAGGGARRGGAARWRALAHELAASVVADLALPPCCLLYTSPSPRDRTRSRMPSSA